MAQGVRKSCIRNRRSKGCGQNIDRACGICPESGEDSIHSTCLTQIQTSQEVDGLRRRMKEAKGRKRGDAGLKVGHVLRVKGC